MNTEIRWKQRFENFEKAFQLLERTVAIESPSEAERGGLIQFFETTFELAWKVLKDYLNAAGFSIKSPREAIKQAFQSEILSDGHMWMKAMEHRNLTTHTYNEKLSMEAEQLIKTEFFPGIKKLYLKLKSEQ
ncbi:MAG: nucleotidyltransferase substrate binding protein [Fibrobacteria bacterium]|nr:nucleotidyltransferase substrate binding protein [Fibrobacteria bacterium]